jgi:hypothetical protein
MNLQENIDRIREVMRLDDNIYYHGTGQLTKVIDALKTKTFIPHKSGGVENGMFITPNIELATEYAKQTGGLRFNQKPHLKKYNGPEDLYNHELSYNHYFIKDNVLKHRQDLLDDGYDGYTTGPDVILIYKERMDILSPID